jgi:hypothetical protein
MKAPRIVFHRNPALAYHMAGAGLYTCRPLYLNLSR